jgi:hypothetical protein
MLGRLYMKPEAAFQKSVIDVLTLLGYKVFETGKSRSKVRCTKCGTYSYATGWQGNTPGLPDIYIHSKHRTWNSQAIAIELKTQKGVVSQVQKEIADAGYTTICRTLEEVLDIVMTKEAANENWTAFDKLRRFREDYDRV